MVTTNDLDVPRLIVIAPAEQVGLVLRLFARDLVIGHSDTADVKLDDRFVSRRHALVTIDESGSVTILDLNSTSGTFINGERLTGARLLRAGDQVRFADLVARFEPGVAPPVADAAADETDGAADAAADETDGGAPGGGTKGPGGQAPDVDMTGPDTAYTVTGTVHSPALPGIGGLTVHLVDKNVGGDQVLAATQTSADGSYAFSQPISADYLAQHHKAQPDLQVQVPAGSDAAGGSQILAASAVRYSAPATVSLDVVLPANAVSLPSEYETLTSHLAAVFPGSLGSLQESSTQQDITYLANKTGWDARAVALGALADQFSQLTAPAREPKADARQTRVWPPPTTRLRPEFYYALFRAGLPASTDSLFRTSPATAQRIWQDAISGGIIPRELAKEVPAATAAFQALSAARSLDAPPPVGLSTMRQMLAVTLPEAAQQDEFAQLYAQHQGDWASFWPAVEQALGPGPTSQLKLTGQLYYLTVNNQPLVTTLLSASNGSANNGNAITSVADLASSGYYDPARWAPLIGDAIPAGIPGTDAGEQAGNYARLLAAQVRVAFPTAVLADQVRRSILPVADTRDIAAGVADFLTANAGQFQVAAEPVEAYLARTGQASSPAVVTQVKRLQRAYQLTPDDASMGVLLRHNLDSAFAITRYDSTGFARAFGDHLGGTQMATAIHARARQISASVLSVAIGYLTGRSAPSLGGQAPVHYGFPPQSAQGSQPAHQFEFDELPPAYPVTAYATLENLFGSLDYCGCSDCGSILSPAAYLVDLLNYLDQPAPTAGLNPQDVLLQRRPDLQYLPLTCANTNTALPYIDIVNETLEYFVANGLSLAGYQGHDTGDAITSAELIASPQYVNDAAYGVLQDALFPPPLPFSRPLTLLRLHLQSLGVALPDAMTALRADDKIVNHGTPTSYGWSDILIERLSISRDEYRLFTDPATGLGDLYGLPEATALGTLQHMNVRDLTRRLRISYDELALIVATQFVNPNAWLIPRLERLGAPFTTLQALHDNLGTSASIEADFISALPAGLDATEYGGATPTDYQAVVSWVTGPKIYPLVMGIITISNPDGSTGDCSGADLQLRYSLPDQTQTKNLLSGTDLVKLIRFIRLWRKLTPLPGVPGGRPPGPALLADGDSAVTIGQADAILAALYPAADIPADSSNPANDAANRPLLDAGFATLLLRLGFLFQVMSQMSLTAGAALAPLLACWAPIGTAGPGALYRKLFLTPILLAQDPGAQTATVVGPVNAGDVLRTSINGTQVAPYTVLATDTVVSVAAAIAAAINATITPDPASGLPLNERFFAASNGGTVTIRAGFTLACSLSGGATEGYTPAAGSPVSASATVAGPTTPGDTLTTTIDGVAITCQVTAADIPATIAAGIAAAINATTVSDPYSGLPLNSLLAATSSGAVVAVTTVNAGAPFTLSCSLDPANAGTYTAAPPIPAAQTATIAGAVQPGDTLVTTINSVQVPYTAEATDADANALAASIAATINAAVQPDPATGLPLSSVVHATSAASVVTITAVDPATPFTLSCQVTAGAETYTAAGPLPESATATVSGTIPAGTALTTTINALPLVYLAASGDTASSIAAAIAAAINACTTADPVTSLPLNSVVTASAAGGVITITSASATTPFTLSASLSAGGYVAGRATPPFADDGYGDFLADPSQTLFGHQPALCAACNLTGAEFALITTTLGFTPSTPLTLANVSALFRYGWLAHALGLSVLEFLLLREFTGLDPFAPLDPAATPPAEPPVIGFTRLLGALAASGLDTNAALYLIWNTDVSGTSAPPADSVDALAFTLRADFAAVDAAFTLRDDPDGSIAKGLMTLVYGTTASDFFFGLLNNTFTTSVSYSTPPGQTDLPQPVIDASAGRLSYDDLRKQLSFGGVLDPATVTAIDTAIVGDPALTAAVASLAAANQQSVGPFFASYPELQPLYEAYAASADPVQARRTTLLSGFLPILQRKRKQEQALAAITSAAGTDPGFAAALLQDPAILHADADTTAAAVADLVAVENPGLSARFFLGNDLSAAPDQVIDAVPSLRYAQTTTVGGTPTAGDVLQTVVNGVAIPYQVGVGDTTTALLAGSVAAAINAATTQDPVSMLPLNQVISAVASGNVITISGRDPSGAVGYFSLDATVSAGATETYAAGSQLPPGQGAGPIAAIWSGYLAAPQDGDYDIDVAADPGASIVLRIGASTVPGTQAGSLWSNQAPISLAAGTLVPFTLTATSIKTTLSVRWRTLGVGWQPIDGQYLYSQSLVSKLASTYTRFLKATSLATDLSLTAAETAFLATTASVDPGWLNLLATLHDPNPATAAALCAVLTDLLDFSQVKHALSPSDERLLAVLTDPAATLPGRPPAQTALLSLTGWAQDSVNALLTHFFGSTDPASLSSVPNFRRVYDAQALVKACGLSAATLIAAITNAPSPATVSALESALRARYAPRDWLAVVGPVNDTARIAQRDALVAYILLRLGDGYAQALVSQTASATAATGATTVACGSTSGVTTGMLVKAPGVAPGTTVTAIAGDVVTISNPTLAALPAGTSLTFAPNSVAFDTPDSLYEYFLIDPQTQPPVRTSRIRLALSAVQLFIERAVRNLEPQVAPADIDLQRWTWMKRYRVWQANREVFLWPENWAYPELRDNQSPLFTQMMSSLLQGDITDDAAASAYLDYLTSLELVAKLEPCGLYYVPGSPDADEVSYVVARTSGAHRKYFFRMLDSGSWTPWAEVAIECEDMPITPIVWNGRLFLFWLKAVKQGQQSQADLSHVKDDSIANFHPSDLQQYSGASAAAAGQGSVTVQAVLCWTEFYNGKWQPAKTSDVNQPTTIRNFDPAGPGSFEACRGQVRIVPATFTSQNFFAWFLSAPFPLPEDALILAITVASDWYGTAGFVLHNTHSLPVRFEDISLLSVFDELFGATSPSPVSLGDVLDWPAPYRSFPTSQPYTGGYGPGTFTIGYAPSLVEQAKYSSDILQYNWMPRWTVPQPGLPDEWDAPFIYEDRRNQFYVTTTETMVPIWAYDGFGFQQFNPGLIGSAGDIPSLVLGQPVSPPAPEGIRAFSAAGGDPAAVRRFLADQNINAALPSKLTITYQGRVISPIGSIPMPERAPGANGPADGPAGEQAGGQGA